MNVVKVKFVEVGQLSVKQQTLPGLGDGNKIPMRREHGALNIDLTMAIDMAEAAIPHTYKRYKLQVFVVNSKHGREEMVFEEQGTGEVNPDEVADEPKEPKLSVVEGAGTEGSEAPEGGEKVKTRRRRAGGSED